MANFVTIAFRVISVSIGVSDVGLSFP